MPAKMYLALFKCLLIVAFAEKSYAQKSPLYFVNAPNVFRLEASESISLSVHNLASPARIEVFLQDYPDRKKTFSRKEILVQQGTPAITSMKVRAMDVPAPSKPDATQYVYLIAKSNTPGLKFQKEVRILLSRRSRVVYMQTDKPLYTPTQTVRFRIIPVGVDLKAFSAGGLTVEIKNPDGKTVERYDRLFTRTGYIVKTFTLGDTPLLGNWTISALYERENNSVTFEVREYVLPRFSVDINGPPFVMESDKYIDLRVKAKYVYGKAVHGLATIKVGVINDRSDVIHVETVRDRLKNGEVLFRIPTSSVKSLKEKIWFPDDDRLNVVASVTEQASGQTETSTDTSIHFSTTPYRITFKRSMKYFKPGLPYEAQVDVKYPSKRPAVRKSILITGISYNSKNKPTDLTSYGKTGLVAVTDNEGRAEVALGVPIDAVSVDIKVKLAPVMNIPDKYNEEQTFKVSPYMSPSKSYTLVRSPEVMPQVGRNTEVETFIFSSAPVKELNYMVLARGKVLLHKTYKDPGAVTSLRFMVLPEMSPSMRMIVYYTIQKNGKTEVVSDYTVIDVKDEFANKVSIETTKKQERPGARTVLTIRGTPNSNAAILAVDKSIYILRDNHKLTPEVVFKGLKKFDLGCGFGGGKDVHDVFKNAGLATITNADLKSETRTDNGCSSDVLSRKRRSVEGTKCCEDGRMARSNPKSCILQAKAKKMDDACFKIFMKCCKPEVFGRSLGSGEEDDDDIPEDDQKVQFRSNFPETWLFGDVVIGNTGVATMNVQVPDTITTWVLQAFATNTQSGLGVADSYELVSFKPFFVQLNLPYSMIRNEQVMLSATVYNFQDTRSVARLYMRGEEGLCYDSRENRRTAPQLLRIKANDAVTVRFPMIPLELGERNVTVIAYTSDGGDAVTRPISIEPEGIEKVKTYSEMIDPTSEAGSKIQTVTMNTDLPLDAIPGSESATFFVTGNVLGPIVTKLLKNVEKALINPVEVYQVSATETFTVTVPQTYTYTFTETYTQYFRSYSPSCTCNVRGGGCLRSRSAQRQKVATGTRQVQRTRTRTVWRQRDRFVMRSIAPNVYVLHYLKRTKQLTDAIKNQAENFIKESYRRMLGHRTKDGSFSMWGNSEAGTIWLTAFVANNFQDASEFVTVDSTVICQAADFLVKSQKTTGAFLEEGQSFSKGLMGGTKGDPAMTALVLVTLINVQCGEMTMKLSTAVEKAQLYLEQKLPSIKNAYDLAITSYALALGNSAKTNAALTALESAATKNDEKKTVFWKAGTESVTVEATSYALLALLAKRKITYSKRIVKWLTQHKNAEGGFSSGQDTVVGLQALAEYASIQPELNLRIDVKSKADPNFKKRFFINKRNDLVQKSIEIPVGGDITVTASGVGTAEVQVELHYNIPRPKDETCPFKTSIKINEIKSKNDYSFVLTACTRYTGEDEVGMSVMEIGVLTGFVPIQESFEKMLKDKKIKRYELSDRAMVVYFEKIRKDLDTCVTVSFKRAFDVGLVQPASVTVKDFLEQSISCTTLYSLSGKSPVMKKLCKGKQCRCMQERCSSCRPTKMRSAFCKKDYVGIFRIRSSRKEGPWTVFTAKVIKLYRGSGYAQLQGRQVDFWVSSGCNCPKFSRNRFYQIMSMEGRKLVLNDQSFIRQAPHKKRDKVKFEKLDAALKNLGARNC